MIPVGWAILYLTIFNKVAFAHAVASDAKLTCFYWLTQSSGHQPSIWYYLQALESTKPQNK